MPCGSVCAMYLCISYPDPRRGYRHRQTGRHLVLVCVGYNIRGKTCNCLPYSNNCWQTCHLYTFPLYLTLQYIQEASVTDLQSRTHCALGKVTMLERCIERPQMHKVTDMQLHCFTVFCPETNRHTDRLVMTVRTRRCRHRLLS